VIWRVIFHAEKFLIAQGCTVSEKILLQDNMTTIHMLTRASWDPQERTHRLEILLSPRPHLQWRHQDPSLGLKAHGCRPAYQISQRGSLQQTSIDPPRRMIHFIVILPPSLTLLPHHLGFTLTENLLHFITLHLPLTDITHSFTHTRHSLYLDSIHE
jgi:hypothetical protein